MKELNKRMNRKLLYNSLLCLLLFTAPPLSWAAVNPLSKAMGKAAETEPTATATTATEPSDADIDANRVKLEARIAELRRQSDPEAVAALHRTYREAATPKELDDWEKLTNKLIGILENHSTSLFRFKNIRKTTFDKVAEMKSWQGFAEKPPYAISFVDNLRDTLAAKRNGLRSLEMIVATIDLEFTEYSNSLRNSNKQVRLAEEDVEKNAGRPGEQRSKWLLKMATLSNEINQAGVVYGETRRLSAAEMQKGVQTEVDLLAQKLAVARSNYHFSAEELKQKLQSIDDLENKVRQKLELAKNSENFARKMLDAAEAAVSKTQAEPVAKGGQSLQLQRLQQAQRRQQLLFDDANLRILIYSGMIQLLKSEKSLWEQRYLVAAGGSRSSRDERTSGQNELELVAKWKAYVTSKISSLELLIKNQQEALSAAILSASGREEIRTTLAIYKGQEELLQQGVLFINDYEQLVQRRDEEAQHLQVTLTDRARGALATVSSLFGKFWYTELYVAEETIIVDDRKITRPRSITVGKVVEAVLILLIGVGVIRYIKKPLHWTVTKRLKLGSNDAQLYTRLLTYVMFIGVLVSALVFVNIPLAVFTFFGGALAIGVGFGAQALISNFISGLILMFDRTIRMGDVVEVDGHRGRVASIGMRSSSIKRFDGVEMLVPNSLFLQQNVINWTSSDPRARYSISVGVAYGSPTREVDRVICKAVEDQPEVLRDPPPYVVFESFADSSLNFIAYFWIILDPEVNSLVVFSDIRHRICERLAEAGIAIPFPQRDLHLAAGQPLEVRMVNTD